MELRGGGWSPCGLIPRENITIQKQQLYVPFSYLQSEKPSVHFLVTCCIRVQTQLKAWPGRGRVLRAREQEGARGTVGGRAVPPHVERGALLFNLSGGSSFWKCLPSQEGRISRSRGTSSPGKDVFVRSSLRNELNKVKGTTTRDAARWHFWFWELPCCRVGCVADTSPPWDSGHIPDTCGGHTEQGRHCPVLPGSWGAELEPASGNQVGGWPSLHPLPA